MLTIAGQCAALLAAPTPPESATSKFSPEVLDSCCVYIAACTTTTNSPDAAPRGAAAPYEERKAS